MWNSHSPAIPVARRASRRRPLAFVLAPVLALWLAMTTRATQAITSRVNQPERGDVPGWVMVTLMTAGLVAVVWLLADEWLRTLFQQAVDRVSGP